MGSLQYSFCFWPYTLLGRTLGSASGSHHGSWNLSAGCCSSYRLYVIVEATSGFSLLRVWTFSPSWDAALVCIWAWLHCFCYSTSCFPARLRVFWKIFRFAFADRCIVCGFFPPWTLIMVDALSPLFPYFAPCRGSLFCSMLCILRGHGYRILLRGYSCTLAVVVSLFYQ